jgi:general secretion pathway protein D
VAFAAALSLVFAACAHAQGAGPAAKETAGVANGSPTPLDKILDQPVSAPNYAAQSPPVAATTELFEGTGVFVAARGRHAKNAAQAGDVTLDFSDADLRDVVRSVLGDMLKLPYAIDPQVNAHITLKTGEPIGRDAVLTALETALRTSGAAILVNNGIYNVVPAADAQKRGTQIIGTDQAVAAGYGVEVVSLHFISADAMQKLVAPIVPQGAIQGIDPERNLIFLSGSAPDRASIRDTIALFDVDYLEGLSYALVRPAHVDVGTLATELSKIFDDASSPVAGLIRMIPIPRINTLLVISARSGYIRQVSRWVSRLDVVPVTPGRQLHYYKLQNARAQDIAKTLAELFGGTQAIGVPHSGPGGSTADMPSSFGSMGSFGASGTTAPPAGSGGFSPVSSSGLTQTQAAPPPPIAAPVSRPQASMLGGDDAPQIVTDESNNALIIRASAADYASIQNIIKEMDVAPDQVLIEATIAEVTLTDELKYGVEWFFQNGGATFAQGASGTPTTKFPGLGITYNIPNVQVALSALGTLTKITVLSAPKVLTLDNKPALLEVGDEVPIVTQTSVSTVGSNSPVVSSIEQRDTGVILTVTPRIGNSGVVFLEISQEVSDVVPTTTSGIDSPTIQQRRIQSTVAVSDGATVALGGLMRRSETVGNGGVPYLKDVPVIGGLFSSHDDTRDRTELLIFLTPRVVRTVPAAAAITADLSKALGDIKGAIDKFGHHEDDIPRMPWH